LIDEEKIPKEYHSGTDKRTFNRSFYYMLTIFTVPGIFVFGYVFIQFLSDGIQNLLMGAFVLIIGFMTFAIVLFAVHRSAKKDQFSSVEVNKKLNYCVFEDKGLKIHFKFTGDTENILLLIPYDEIKFIDKCDRNILREIWEGKPDSQKWMRYLPMLGTGILYPNFTYPDDLLRIKLKQVIKLKNIGPLLKPVKDSSDIIYINVDRTFHVEFMKELRSRMRT